MTDLLTGKPAPKLDVDQWFQGPPCDLHSLIGEVVLIEVFQVNCPGCFAHALPEAARLHETYQTRGLTVLGIATAFEEFERNTAANLQHLLETGELQGAPLQQLDKAGDLDNGRLPYDIPFSIATDRLVENTDKVDDAAIDAFILSQLADFHSDNWSDERRQIIHARAVAYLQSKTHKPQTFERYGLQGTPSSIVIDRSGIVRLVKLGVPDGIEALIEELLQAPAAGA